MAEFTIESSDGTPHDYKSGRLPAMTQQLVVKRLLPLGGAVGAAARDLQTDPIKAFQHLTQSLAQMPDADVTFVVQTCLAVVHRRQGDQWARVLPSGGAIAFDDIGLLQMNELVFHVLKDNLSDFFFALARRGLLPTS